MRIHAALREATASSLAKFSPHNLLIFVKLQQKREAFVRSLRILFPCRCNPVSRTANYCLDSHQHGVVVISFIIHILLG